MAQCNTGRVLYYSSCHIRSDTAEMVTDLAVDTPPDFPVVFAAIGMHLSLRGPILLRAASSALHAGSAQAPRCTAGRPASPAVRAARTMAHERPVPGSVV